VDFCYGRIASAKVPRYVAVGLELPYSGRGKVQKFILKDTIAAMVKEGRLEKLVPTEVRAKKGSAKEEGPEGPTRGKASTAHAARPRTSVGGTKGKKASGGGPKKVARSRAKGK
jgi:hypothetical protein